jgi:hypothetical protein
MKPVMNVDTVKFDDVEENGLYTSSRGHYLIAVACDQTTCQWSLINSYESVCQQ